MTYMDNLQQEFNQTHNVDIGMFLEDLNRLAYAVTDGNITLRQAVDNLIQIYKEMKEHHLATARDSLPGPGVEWKTLVANVRGAVTNKEHNPLPRMTQEEYTRMTREEDEAADKSYDRMSDLKSFWRNK